MTQSGFSDAVFATLFPHWMISSYFVQNVKHAFPDKALHHGILSAIIYIERENLHVSCTCTYIFFVYLTVQYVFIR